MLAGIFARGALTARILDAAITSTKLRARDHPSSITSRERIATRKRAEKAQSVLCVPLSHFAALPSRRPYRDVSRRVFLASRVPSSGNHPLMIPLSFSFPFSFSLSLSAPPTCYCPVTTTFFNFQNLPSVSGRGCSHASVPFVYPVSTNGKYAHSRTISVCVML